MKAPVVKFDVSKKDRELIEYALNRAAAICRNAKVKLDRLKLEMDLVAAHRNGCKLDFAKLLGFDDTNFMHDISGISRHIDRTTGKLTDCFMPRCVVPKLAAWERRRT